jgi:hypothetical protein
MSLVDQYPPPPKRAPAPPQQRAVAKAAEIDGWMSEPELDWLYRVAQHMDTIAELGSWKGRSSYALAAGVRVRLYCVDTFMGSLDELETNHMEAREGRILDQFLINMDPWMNEQPWGHFHRYESGKLSITVQDHNAAAADLPDVDMVFLDGAHDYESVLSNIAAWKPKCRKLFAGHDINWPGVLKTVGESFPGQQINWAGVGSIWCMRMESR